MITYDQYKDAPKKFNNFSNLIYQQFQHLRGVKWKKIMKL